MTTTAETLCIVLSPGPQRLPLDVRSAIEARGWRAIAAQSPLAALAEAAVHERISAARAAWGLQRSENIAMVIVDPPALRETDALLDALRRYFPSVAVLAAQSGQLIELSARPVDSGGGHKPAAAQARMDMQREGGRNGGPATDGESPTGSSTVTREELDMLLGISMVEPEPRTTPAPAEERPR
jgi:hypothetical protein